MASMPPVKKYAFVFICQKGKLELMSCLLSASLKKFVKVDYEMIVAIPGPESFFGKPAGAILDFLKKLGCRFFYFENEFVREGKTAAHHLTANKIFALKAQTDAEKIIFLDSDQLCCEDFYGDASFFIPFSATSACYTSSEYFAEKAADIYSGAGLEIPKARFKVLALNLEKKDIFLPPYFYSGFVAVDSNFVQELGSIWLQFFKYVSENLFFADPYYSDEISLSLAVQKTKTPFFVLGSEWKDKIFFNYGDIGRIKKNPNLLGLVKDLLFEYPGIRELAKFAKDCAPFFESIFKNNISDGKLNTMLKAIKNSHKMVSEFSAEKTEDKVAEKTEDKSEEVEILKPWMTDNEINLFKSYLGRDKIVFEWGAGGSTIEFSKCVKEYYSVEHDFEWYNKVSKKAGRNVKIYYIPPNAPDLKWLPVFEEGEYRDFKNYIEFINSVASFGKKIDIILIDGRARVDCAMEALPYMSENAVVFIHDFDRVYYWKILEHYEIAAVAGKLAALKRKKEIFNDDRIILIKEILLNGLMAGRGLKFSDSSFLC